MDYPYYRPRRLRQNENLRRLIRETHLSVDNLIAPYFVVEGRDIRSPIQSMPGVHRLSVDNLLKEAAILKKLKIPAILLFGIPKTKDESGALAYDEEGVTQRAVREIKKKAGDLVVITDVCLCSYTSHGHCGVIKKSPQSKVHSRRSKDNNDGRWTMGYGLIDNDATLEILGKIAASHARAGADLVAPSAMMDGQVKVIREALDAEEFVQVGIMAYSAKYASSFYGPFREAMASAPEFGDRKSYQMDSANVEEALREIKLDIEEGADCVMIKPALGYLDVISKAKDRFNLPIAAYNVSGEYSLVKAAAKAGWIDEKKAVLEILTGIRRAGADMIITYYAKEVANWLNQEND